MHKATLLFNKNPCGEISLNIMTIKLYGTYDFDKLTDDEIRSIVGQIVMSCLDPAYYQYGPMPAAQIKGNTKYYSFMRAVNMYRSDVGYNVGIVLHKITEPALVAYQGEMKVWAHDTHWTFPVDDATAKELITAYEIAEIHK